MTEPHAPAETALPDGAPFGGTVTCLFSDIEGSTRIELEVGTGPYRDLREKGRGV